MVRKHFNIILLLVIFAIVFTAMSILTPEKFLSFRNFQSMAYQIPEFGILSLAMFLSIISGGINLSTVNTASLSGVVGAILLVNFAAKQTDQNGVLIWIIVTIFAMIVTSLLCGLINGFMIGGIGVSPILVTLGTLTFFHGISLRIAGGTAGGVTGFPQQFLWIGNATIFKVPVPFIIFIITVIIVFIIMKTSYGFSIYMIGSNPTASMFSGIKNKIVILKNYVFSGLLCGIAAVIMISRYNSAKADYGSSYLLQSILAVILGGTSIAGGFGTIQGLILAILILQMISSGLNIFGLTIGKNVFLVDIIWGSLIIIIMAINFLMARRNNTSIERM
ncbi:MAG: ABC transporter permease [Actinobacteria bacterium]|nr:ABC transporter permease [Actinomycetota bacterium]